MKTVEIKNVKLTIEGGLDSYFLIGSEIINLKGIDHELFRKRDYTGLFDRLEELETYIAFKKEDMVRLLNENITDGYNVFFTDSLKAVSDDIALNYEKVTAIRCALCYLNENPDWRAKSYE